MKQRELKRALEVAVTAAREAGELMRKNQWSAKKVAAIAQHDIKLELDVRCQALIEERLAAAFPEIPLLAEEGREAEPDSEYRWVVDPIDGTVNFAYGIPHACVSVALQGPADRPATAPRRPDNEASESNFRNRYQTLVGTVFDPFCDETWTAIRGEPARLNGRRIHVSPRAKLSETIITLGFAKHAPGLEKLVPRFQQLIHRVRKIRIMGSAALDLVYVATGRIDAYVETGVRLWDIAAGGLIIECAGGEFWHRRLTVDHIYHVVANNGLLRRQLERIART